MLVVRIDLKEPAVFSDCQLGLALLDIGICYSKLCKRSIFLGKVPVFYFEKQRPGLIKVLLINKLVRLIKRTFSI
jgi:hypothetical protein